MLEQYLRKPHPAKEILVKQYGLELTIIANYLGLSYPYCCNLMRGALTTKKHDKKLNELIELCRKETGYKCEPDTGLTLT